MLHEALARYFGKIENSIRSLRTAYVELYEEEALSPERANLRIRIRFDTGHLLEINEAAIVENQVVKRLGFRYHLQDSRNRLVFRYDNAPHFPSLSSYPFHKHIQAKVVEAGEPTVLEVLVETTRLVEDG